MTLYDFLKVCENEEVIVIDEECKFEAYYYPSEIDSGLFWNELSFKFAQKLTVMSIYSTDLNQIFVAVNLSEIIRKNLKNLTKTDLFFRNDAESIVEDLSAILAGHIGEGWFEKFVNTLE